MKNSKRPDVKGDKASISRCICRSVTGGKKSLKSSAKQTSVMTGTVDKLSTVIEQEEKQMPHLAAKIKLQLFPLDDEIRRGLEKDGNNPFLELTLRPRKKISSIITHLCNKWGSSSIAKGELILFPFNSVAYNLTSSKRWTSSDAGVTAGDVHAAIGSPVIFRLRYGWFSTSLNKSNSFLSLGCTELDHLERISPGNFENPAGLEHQTEVKSKDPKPYNVNEVTNMAAEQTVLAKSHLLVHNQAEVNDEDLNPSMTSKQENANTAEDFSSAEQFKYEDPRLRNDASLTSLLWNDLSNISIGGLLSEVSLQGRFNTQDSKQGGSRLTSQPAAVLDSLDAFINQITCPQASNTLAPDMPSSILDAEDTCHSFAVLKPSPSSGKGFLTLERRAFSELSNQGVAPRPFKCPKSEAHVQEGATTRSANEDQKTEPLPFSGVFNSENSLGLSSIRWNDSLGPFDPQLTSRQIINDDSIGIGGLVR